MVETLSCVHCGAAAKYPVQKTIAGQLLTFCCKGCLQVYEMLHEEDEIPASPAPGHPAALQTISLPILGMSCANCVAAVERNLRKVDGVHAVSVSLARAEATLQLDPQRAPLAQLKRAVQAAGYETP